jgi:hypothetical protein
MNAKEFLKEQLIYTVGSTKKKLLQLFDAYNDQISFKQHTEKFDPLKNPKNFMIDGLNKPKSYVHNAFAKLTSKTDVTIKINNYATVCVTFYHKEDVNDTDLIGKCIKRIHCMLNVFGNKDNISIYDGMTIDILLYFAPRVMTEHFKRNTDEINEIGKKFYFNCTSGYASIEDGKFKLCVSRKNGCLGLLVHELGHICELDLGKYNGHQYNFPNGRLNGWKYLVKKYFDVDNSCHIGNMTEGINNGNSSIIHSMFIVLESKLKDTRPDNLFNEYKLCYEKEFVYAIEMLGKLLKWFKYKSLQELFKKRTGRYTQKSLLLEYILVRCIYLMHFKQLCVFKNNDTMPEIDDSQYTLHFFKKMVNSVDILDNFLRNIKNNGITKMEYYYNA